MVKVQKKGDISVYDNSPGMTLLLIPSKLFFRVNLNRIRMVVDLRIREKQAGLRAGRVCSDQIFALRKIAGHFIELKSWHALKLRLEKRHHFCFLHINFQPNTACSLPYLISLFSNLSFSACLYFFIYCMQDGNLKFQILEKKMIYNYYLFIFLKFKA